MRAVARAVLPATLAFFLQSSSCHAHFCSGDCGDDDDDDGSRAQAIVLLPVRVPLGRPLADLILLSASPSLASER